MISNLLQLVKMGFNQEELWLDLISSMTLIDLQSQD
jgi:hypothetical protein